MSVRLEGVRKEFADPARPGGTLVAVRDMRLDIAEGEFVTLLGPSGCGKTTTLRMVAGFETPDSGDIYIGDARVNDDPPNMRDTTMVFQSYAIFPHMSVGRNVGFGLELRGRPKAEIRRESYAVMEMMGISDLADRRPDQLSGGQQQRVALARAVVNRPGVLLFDEPLSNLDAKLRETMRLEIRRLQRAFGITSIYVTHDQAEAMTVSDRIVVMDRGSVMQVGTPFEIYSRPASRFVADFIGRVNLFPGTFRSSGMADGTAGVALDAGFMRASGSVAEIADGDRALLMVRPESLRLGKEAAAFPFAVGRVTKAVYLGQVVEYELDADLGKPVLAVSHDPVVSGFFKPGDIVPFGFPTEASHALPEQ